MLGTIQNLLTKYAFKQLEPILGLEDYKSFLNDLGWPTQLVAILKSDRHSSQPRGGWEGIASLTCLGENQYLYDIDVRHAWGSEVFEQNLFHFDWSESTLLHKKLPLEPPPRKLIIYL